LTGNFQARTDFTPLSLTRTGKRMTSVTFTGTFLRRDRPVVLAGLGSIVLLSWVYLGYLAWNMTTMMDMSDAGMGMEMAMPAIQPWGTIDYVLMFIMWSVMMFAMMTPSAAPMVLTYTRINRQQQAQLKPVPGTAVFYLGYLLVWTAFSAVATLAQGGLHAATLLSPMMETTSPVLGGIILIAAGVFQFTPLKYACLSHCRTPLGFFMAEWRDGKWGALVMGGRHGAFCVGCCWLIMALLFVAGVMNLFWIAVIAAYVLAEKLLPGGHKVSWGIGALMIGWGVWMITGVLL
jgi:predicted metal-binding membrane protein